MEYESEEDQKKKMEAISNNFDAKKGGDVIRRVFCTQEENKKIRRDDDHGGCRGSNETYLREKASRKKSLSSGERFCQEKYFFFVLFCDFLDFRIGEEEIFLEPKNLSAKSQ